MSDFILGKKVAAIKRRDASILYPIARPVPKVDMFGYDLWRAYEFLWLEPSGKPSAAVLEIIYPRQSRFIVESKSLKLYLNGFAFEGFSSADEVSEIIKRDLNEILKSTWVDVRVYSGRNASAIVPSDPGGFCIDSLIINLNEYYPDPEILKTADEIVTERLYSELLHTNCPVTSQPDMATVIIEYHGKKILHDSLLKYICSFRDFEDFTESCCEKIFSDILDRCQPEKLLVQCLYTRRGGIDINPIRATFELKPPDEPGLRHYRQ
jgi:7-cyano-7-deazaguanine reductase